jgi:hypothetical protein
MRTLMFASALVAIFAASEAHAQRSAGGRGGESTTEEPPSTGTSVNAGDIDAAVYWQNAPFPPIEQVFYRDRDLQVALELITARDRNGVDYVIYPQDRGEDLFAQPFMEKLEQGSGAVTVGFTRTDYEAFRDQHVRGTVEHHRYLADPRTIRDTPHIVAIGDVSKYLKAPQRGQERLLARAFHDLSTVATMSGTFDFYHVPHQRVTGSQSTWRSREITVSGVGLVGAAASLPGGGVGAVIGLLGAGMSAADALTPDTVPFFVRLQEGYAPIIAIHEDYSAGFQETMERARQASLHGGRATAITTFKVGEEAGREVFTELHTTLENGEVRGMMWVQYRRTGTYEDFIATGRVEIESGTGAARHITVTDLRDPVPVEEWEPRPNEVTVQREGTPPPPPAEDTSSDPPGDRGDDSPGESRDDSPDDSGDDSPDDSRDEPPSDRDDPPSESPDDGWSRENNQNQNESSEELNQCVDRTPACRDDGGCSGDLSPEQLAEVQAMAHLLGLDHRKDLDWFVWRATAPLILTDPELGRGTVSSTRIERSLRRINQYVLPTDDAINPRFGRGNLRILPSGDVDPIEYQIEAPELGNARSSPGGGAFRCQWSYVPAASSSDDCGYLSCNVEFHPVTGERIPGIKLSCESGIR